MAPPKFGGLSQFVQRTKINNKSMEDTTGVVDVDEIPTIESESINPKRFEEKNPR
jgi:hypothetical protein